ncbi:efflux RND transporter periplasmic adaptor subunit [Candidatus Nitrospira inopinata]|jgi:cobalt-zinc-cadmium efflux system membrane fusion protein|nr:efflux RND transporter periplasmic adaptor subunit [Candidatus Nitrospira inopinata]
MTVIVAALAVVSPACQPKQEEAEPKKSPRVEAESSQPGLLELSEKSQALAQIQTDQAAVRPLRLALKAQGGKILPNENRLAHLGVRVPGRILAVYANLGDRVKADDPLLKLDSPAVGEALLEYRKRRTAALVAEKALERARLLFTEGAIGAAEYQRREAELDNAKADLDEAEEKLHLLGMTEREIERLTAKELPHAEVAQVFLRAPFAGDIIERNATVGEVVDVNQTLFTVADLSTVWVRADFPEQQAGLLRTGLEAEVRVSAYPDIVFRGAVTYVGAVIDPATRTIMVRAELPNSDRRLRPHMFVDATLLVPEQPALTIPRKAVQQVGERTVVFLPRGPSQFEVRDVRLGAISEPYVEVKAGLAAGDKVVTEGSYMLKSEILRDQMPTGGPL